MKEEEILKIIGEKFIARFDMPDGSKNMAICGDHEKLAALIKAIREMKGRNIIITDETLFYFDKED